MTLQNEYKLINLLISSYILFINSYIFSDRFSNFEADGKERFLSRLSEFNTTFLLQAFGSYYGWDLAMKELQVVKSHEKTNIVFANPENFEAVWHFWEFAGFQEAISSGK